MAHLVGEWGQRAPHDWFYLSNGVAAVGRKIHVFCGAFSGGSYSKMHWVWDQRTDQWTQLPDFPGLGRIQVGTAVIGTKIYMAGGNAGTTYSPTGVLPELWEYDTVTGVWTQKADMPGVIQRHGCTSMGTKVYVCGGESFNSNLASEDIFWTWDQATNSWSVLTPMINGGLYINEIFPTWPPSNSPKPGNRVACRALGLNGKVHVLGGGTTDLPAEVETNPPSYGGGFLSNTHIAWDVASGNWQTYSTIPLPLIQHGVAVVDGEIYMAGGRTQAYSSPYNIARTGRLFAWDELTDIWHEGPSNWVTFDLTEGAGIGDQFYLAGGVSFGIYTLNTLFEFPYRNLLVPPLRQRQRGDVRARRFRISRQESLLRSGAGNTFW